MRQMVFNINSQHAKISEVVPGLFISGVCALTPSIIAANKIDVIINTTVEVPNVKSLGKVEYVKVSLKDAPDADIYSHFDYLCAKIERMIKTGKKVLIHSVQGVSRCATFCLAYIIKAHEKSLADAYELLKSKRVMVKINEGFWKQLTAFEQAMKNLQDECYESSTSFNAEEARSNNEINSSGGETTSLSDNKYSSRSYYDPFFGLSEYPQTESLSFAQAFYSELKKRAKRQRKIRTVVFKPVLEPLYEQAEIVA
uniref:Protein-tyrosine-phosphatase n=1 Tax=Syphacia muris TaxID=451379 RepID=A0A0N5ASQ9_9BILA